MLRGRGACAIVASGALVAVGIGGADCGADDASGGDGGADSSVDAPQGCDLGKDPKDSLACVASSVGVFVDSTKSDSNNGAKETPVATVGKGLALAKQKGLPRIYVCEGTYAEDLVIDAAHDGISIYGGWKCADWSYSGGKPVIGKTTTASKLDALTQGTTIEDVAITAPDATTAGESSVAMFVNGSQNVALSRVALSAGVGVKGGDGTLTNFTFPVSLDGNNANGLDGGAPKTVPCPAGDTSVGGKGGSVTLVPTDFNGATGSPALGAGDGGSGGSTCTNGMKGADAPTGDAGIGAATNGALGTAWLPTAGGDGANGGAGQGGGGGGATSQGVGQQGGGGSGGAGGCGGAGGGAGKGGGSSIGLVVMSSTVSVVSSTISTKNAGDGGNGAAGQSAQSPAGKPGQDPLAYGCKGGFGGLGGSGGAGGGGAGGLSVGIFYKGTMPTLDSATTGAITVGTKGSGGTGPAGNNGVDGMAQGTLECKAPVCN